MSIRIPATLALGLLLAPGPGRAALADLDEFVKRPDPSYSWKAVESKDFPEGKAHQLALTSQTWQGKPWTHALQVFEPKDVVHPDVMLLFITGGANRVNQPRFRNAQEGFALAKACGARVAVLPQVPNQPLLDGKVEDDLIAETFVRYLETRDEDLPLLQPMAKSAVKAMDAVQDWAKREGRPVPAKFVVSGASKRGWTTWLAGAVDPRVAAIAPMVIPTLNMREQNKHQLATWGKYSEQIDDYVRRGLMEKIDTPDGAKLWKLIDPYTYRDRLAMPKLQINGTNDPYWTLDSLNLYWADLKGPSHVVYLPNAGHDLKEHRDWAIHGVGALFRHVAAGRPMPTVSSRHEVLPGGGLRIAVDAVPGPKQARAWVARSASPDFRQARWSAEATSPSSPPGPRKEMSLEIKADQGPYLAAFYDLTYEIDGLEYHLSTPIRISGPKGEEK